MDEARVLTCCVFAYAYSHRHLLNDLTALLPHGRRESKFESKKKLQILNELAELYNCNNVRRILPPRTTQHLTNALRFSSLKQGNTKISTCTCPRCPTGQPPSSTSRTCTPCKHPICKVRSYSTATDSGNRAELHFTGNCLKGSRPILSFDAAFDKEPHLKLLRELFTHVFGVPPGARKSKPFIDHVLGFTIADGKIWVRHYQISEKDSVGETEMNLIEIGPRMLPPTIRRCPS